MVAGPTLGKAVGDELVIYAEGKDAGDDRRAGSEAFTPLMLQYIEDPLDLIFLTDACLVGSTGAVKRAQKLADAVRRDLSAEGGMESASIAPIPLALEQYGRVHCQSIVDVLPSTTVTEGDFVFAAEVVSGKDTVERGEVSFAVDLTTPPSDER